MNKQRVLACGSVLVFIAALVICFLKSPMLLKIKYYYVYPEGINQYVRYECRVYENGVINYTFYKEKPLDKNTDISKEMYYKPKYSNLDVPVIDHFIDTKFYMTAFHGEHVCNERELQEIKELLEKLDSDEELVVSKEESGTSYIDVTYKGKKRTYPSTADYWTTYMKLEYQLMLLCPIDLPEIKLYQIPPSVMY